MAPSTDNSARELVNDNFDLKKKSCSSLYFINNSINYWKESVPLATCEEFSTLWLRNIRPESGKLFVRKRTFVMQQVTPVCTD